MLRHQLVTTPWETDVSWYDPRQNDARFVIWAPQNICRNACLSAADLRAQFGPPSATYKVGSFRVLVWQANLLANVKTVSWCGYAWAWSTRAKPSAAPCN
jgi:hypothetical protein